VTGQDELGRVLTEIRKRGLLLLTDRQIPNLTTLIAGEPVRGSWWGHPRSHDIFAMTQLLGHHPDVLRARLVAKKITYVHRSFWSALIGVATSREAWQLSDLSPAALSILGKVEVAGQIRSDDLGKIPGPGPAIRELEDRLLIDSREVHTASGTHRKVLQTWDRWKAQFKWSGRRMSPDDARRRIEKTLELLNREFEGNARLPWA